VEHKQPFGADFQNSREYFSMTQIQIEFGPTIATEKITVPSEIRCQRAIPIAVEHSQWFVVHFKCHLD
jgi:hypothetical protein